MSDLTPVGIIYNHPPPDLVDLYTALIELKVQNYHSGLVLWAATQTYIRLVEEHYARYHEGDTWEACDCKPPEPPKIEDLFKLSPTDVPFLKTLKGDTDE